MLCGLCGQFQMITDKLSKCECKMSQKKKKKKQYKKCLCNFWWYQNQIYFTARLLLGLHIPVCDNNNNNKKLCQVLDIF